jgi:hypothetical protein
MKKCCVLIVLLLSLVLIRESFSKELFDKQGIKREPVNAVRYIDEGMDYGLAILTRLLKTGKPTGMWNKENPQGVAGLGITLIEGFLYKNLDLVGGAIMEKEKLRYSFWGIEAKLFLKGKLGKVLSKFRPGIYWSEDEWWFGVSLALRGLSTQGG